MLGDGVVIESVDQARDYDRAVRAHPEVWEGRALDVAPVAVGERLHLQPCVPDNWPLAKPGQPCPRVGLRLDNRAAAECVMAALPEHTRPLLPAFVRARLAEIDRRDRRLITLRVVRALQSEPVQAWLYPPLPERAKPEEATS